MKRKSEFSVLRIILSPQVQQSSLISNYSSRAVTRMQMETHSRKINKKGETVADTAAAVEYNFYN